MKMLKQTFSLKITEVFSLDRGENRVSLLLPLESELPILDYQYETRVGSKSQACNQMVMLYLLEHGHLTQDDFDKIVKRTKIFRTDKEFLADKMIQYKRTIEQKETIEMFIPREDLGYLKKMLSILQTQPYEKLQRFIPGYYKKAREYLSHPLGKECLLLLDRITEQR